MSPVALSAGIPATMLGCENCYFHGALTAYGSLDFCNPYGTASCAVWGFSTSVYLREIGAYLEGVVDLRGTVAITNPTFQLPTLPLNLLGKTFLGSFTFTVAGMPITIYCYLNLNIVFGGSVTVYGRWSMSASFYSSAAFGAAYNYVLDSYNPGQLFAQWQTPTFTPPTPDFSGILGGDVTLTVDLQPILTLSLYDSIDIFVQFDPTLYLQARVGQPYGMPGVPAPASCGGLGIRVQLGVTYLVGMGDITWGGILTALSGNNVRAPRANHPPRTQKMRLYLPPPYPLVSTHAG